MNTRVKVLLITNRLAMPGDIPDKERMAAFSENFDCLRIGAVLSSKHEGNRNISGCRQILFRSHFKNFILTNLEVSWRILYHALHEYFSRHRYRVVISPNPLLTGLIAIFVARVTGAKTIIEVNGNFKQAFRFGSGGGFGPGRIVRLKSMVAEFLIPFVLKRAGMVKLVHSHQLDPLNLNFKVNTSAFPDFVPVQMFSRVEHSEGRYILLLGYPWYLKGVDILIKAFNLISDEFPDFSLKVVGWCPEGRDYFEMLARPNPRIELRQPVFYDKVIELMSNCSLYVLASRTDPSPRGLCEAMACRKPIIASNIEGMSHLIRHGYNGLLFQSESVDDLAEKMKPILRDGRLSAMLANNGYDFVNRHFSEKRYIENYRSMISAVLKLD